VADETPAANPAKVEAKSSRERQLAGLKPAKPGEVRNPTGKNGREGSEAWRKFLDMYDAEETNKSRRLCMHETWYKLIRSGDANALKLGVEQDQGKAKQQIDLSNEDGSLRAPTINIGFGRPAEAQEQPTEETKPEGADETTAGETPPDGR
jgi:hypothetical protein